MYLLTDIALSNWYLIRREQIRIRGASALVGPTGAGKSTIFDAVGTVLAGNNASRLALNASASGRSARTVRDYCLGWISDPAEGGRPTREACETVLCLVFENEVTGRIVSVGLALAARAEEQKEEVLSRFVCVGHRFEIEDYARTTPEGSFTAPWSEIAADLRARAERFEEFRTSGERFTAELLASLREGAPVPDPRHFLRTFSNAVAFKPIFDSSGFVRSFVLDPEPLDVGRIRQSVENWRRLLDTIRELETKLQRLARLVARYESWGDAVLAAATHEARASVADLRRRSLDCVAIRSRLREGAEALRIARESVRSSQGFVREIDGEIAERKAMIAGSGAQGHLAAANAGLAMLERDRRELAARVADLVGLVQQMGRLMPVAGALRPVAPQAARLAEACARSGLRKDAPLDEMLRADGTLAGLLDGLARLDPFDEALDRAAEDAGLQARAQEAEAERTAPPPASGAQVARLSSDTVAFRAELARLGIDAVPVCELAEIVDPVWGPALEALLGRAREALIVAPERLDDALGVLQGKRNLYHRCILVKTTDTARQRARRFDEGALSVIETSDPHAEAFLAVRLGGYDLAANDAELRHMSRAVAPSGRTTAGMAYSVTRSVDLLMTRGERGPSPESRRRHEAAVTEARRLRQEAVVLREAARNAAAIRARITRGGLDVDALREEADGLEGRRRTLSTERETIEKRDTDGLAAEIKDLTAERIAYLRELAEVLEPKLDALLSEEAQLKARLASAREAARAALAARRGAMHRLRVGDAQRIRLARSQPLDPAEVAEVRGELRGLDPKAVTTLANAERALAKEASESARSHGRAAERDLAEYCAQWRIENPLGRSDLAGRGEAPATFGYDWARREHDDVAGHELRRYRAQAERAEGEMRRLMTEDLLTRLADKFERVRSRLDALNERLSSQTFTGQTYAFEATVDRRYAAVHALATEVARSPDAAQALLPASGEGPMAAALQEISDLIAGSEDAARLADYRNYFVYEIGMRDRAGNRTTMSSRALRGSGGEAQAPFYVAIAASLASAYYPGDRPGDENPGLGLCLLDEAFSKLDVRNSQGLVDLYRAWGLQLLIAAPEDKRTTLTEVMDTIVTVYKSPDLRSVRIESEHPLEAAKRALAAINPERRGIEGFHDGSEGRDAAE
ncbi:energy-coupling factor transporter ATP-binding protein EcfA2 [Methylobacterium sp. BE186]|uniref:SbcC/MukB-like Walker B domain-containing protein n=1 Tax=Methylobacterium sp. BE186 TaxID=2817715 RepID=UPI00285AFC22|nr:SbcC/MukB-like Walker B domain-containing protein [Methylobacterium sp. BE186]MDR7038779.1 energy-coupling factor transporter ATP-binding protein EcfA2 [Methylobacterium sp. BE186]